jgi:hypothetical protein
MKHLILLAVIALASICNLQAQEMSNSEVRQTQIYFGNSFKVNNQLIQAGTQIVPGPKGSKGLMIASSLKKDLLRFRAKDRPEFIDVAGNRVIFNFREQQIFTDHEGNPVLVSDKVIRLPKDVLQKANGLRDVRIQK